MFTAWSLSRYKDFTKCPAFAKYRYIDKLPEEKGEAAARGIAVHQNAESFLKKGKTLVPEWMPLRRQLMALRTKPHGSSEQKWAFNSKWQPVTYFAKDAWVRMVLDYKYKTKKSDITVIDFKTGKIREEEHKEQMGLYAAGSVAVDPDIKTIKVELWYVDHKKITKDEFTSEHAVMLQKEWVDKVQPMLTARQFPPRPNPLCSWCAYSKAKGGPCKF